MLARRIVAASPDKAFGKQLALALRVAGGAVEIRDTLDAVSADELGAALWVLHLDGGVLEATPGFLARLTGDCQAILVLPRMHLATVVDAMLASDRVAGVMFAEDFDGHTLSAMARRVLSGDVFGIEKLMMWGVQLHSQLVGDFHEKSLCMSQIAEFAELVGVPRPFRAGIEQCIDEMVMNALFDAPVDQDGRPIFREVPTKTRIALRTEQQVVVQYAFDGRHFAVSVRDAFGSLDRETVLRVLHKCLHAEQPVDRRAGGAGLGLYLVASSSTAVYFNLAPGVATEVICVFDLDAPEAQLEHFGFFFEQIDEADGGAARQFSAGAMQASAPRLPPAPRGGGRFVTLGLVLAIAATLVLIGVAGWSRVFGVRRAEITLTTTPAGAAIEIDGKPVGTAVSGTLVVDGLALGRSYLIVAKRDGYQPGQVVVQPHAGSNQLTLELVPRTAVVEIDSDPSGATVEVGGAAIGTTPMTATSLTPGADVTLAFRRAGYRAATARLRVPGAGENTRLVQHLDVSDNAVRVRFVSTPPGAQVVRIGQATPGADRTYTPSEILVDAGVPQRFMLTMPNHVPLVIEPFTPARDGGVIEKGGALTEGVALHIEAKTGGVASVSGAPHCAGLAVPADCMLARGSYTIELVAPGGARATKKIEIADRDASVAF